MGFLYGNINNHLPRTHFNFQKVYQNRKEMQYEIENTVTQDYTLLNSYLLVDYKSGTRTYKDNQQIDIDEYGNDNFDLTVWQIQEINNSPKCIAIARLHSILPTFEVCGNYKVGLAPTASFGGEQYGKGKNIYPINNISDIPQ